MNYATMEAPPEGVLAGESIPRENEVQSQEIYQKLKEDRLETIEKNNKKLGEEEGGDK